MDAVEIKPPDDNPSTSVECSNSLPNSSSENDYLTENRKVHNEYTERDDRVENDHFEKVYDPEKVYPTFNVKLDEKNLLDTCDSEAQIFYNQVIKLEKSVDNQVEYSESDFIHQPLSFQDLNLIYMDDSLHICNICDKTFARKCDLKQHYRIHTRENPYSCEHCEAKLPTVLKLEEHLCTHSGLKPYACNLCSKSFARSSNLSRHYATHIGEKTYQCDQCEGCFLDSSRLKEHYQTHVGEKRFACDLCDKRFLKKYNLQRHYRTHTGEHPYTCDICGRCYSKKLYLLLHVNTHVKEAAKAEENMKSEVNAKVTVSNEDVKIPKISFEDIKKEKGDFLPEKEAIKNSDLEERKNKVKKITNDSDDIKQFTKNENMQESYSNDLKSKGSEEDQVCNMAYSYPDQALQNLSDAVSTSPDLKNSIQLNSDQIISSQNLFSCKPCNRHFIKENSYLSHLKTHMTKEVIQCEVCKATFTHRSRLKEHFVTHSGEKAFSCALCSRQFSRNSNLIRHFATHTGERRHKCDICHKQYCSAVRLREHILFHTGEKPHHCDICNRSFRHKNGLRRHSLTHTGEKPYKCGLCTKRFIRKKSLNSHHRKQHKTAAKNSIISDKTGTLLSNLAVPLERQLLENQHKSEPDLISTDSLKKADCQMNSASMSVLSTDDPEPVKRFRKHKPLKAGRLSVQNNIKCPPELKVVNKQHKTTQPKLDLIQKQT